jgi:hypothetical protein
MRWTSYESVEFQGRPYAQTDIDFRWFMDLPARVAPSRPEITPNEGKTAGPPRDHLNHKGMGCCGCQHSLPGLEGVTFPSSGIQRGKECCEERLRHRKARVVQLPVRELPCGRETGHSAAWGARRVVPDRQNPPSF